MLVPMFFNAENVYVERRNRELLKNRHVALSEQNTMAILLYILFPTQNLIVFLHVFA